MPDEIEKYRLRLPVERMHDAIFYSSLLIGESATMASEAAVLGVPAIYVDDKGTSNTDDEAKAGLIFYYKPSEKIKVIEKAMEILNSTDNEIIKVKRNNYFKEKIDVTAFFVWLIERWPKSKYEIRNTAEFWGRFK